MPQLQANDGSMCVVTNDQLALCNVLHVMSEHIDPTETIPIDVDGRQLHWLRGYLATHIDSSPSMRDQRCMSLFTRCDDPVAAVRLANYLDVPSLQAHACMHVASLVRRCRSSDEINRMFDNVPDVQPTISRSDDESIDDFTLLMAQVARACVVPIVF